jgi:hypothetical protein
MRLSTHPNARWDCADLERPLNSCPARLSHCLPTVANIRPVTALAIGRLVPSPGPEGPLVTLLLSPVSPRTSRAGR